MSSDDEETRTAAGRDAAVVGSDDAETDALSPGQTVGRFTVLSRVGQGGMGQVFAAYDPTLDRRIALKVLRSAGSATDRERLAREAKALARLSDPNVVTVFEVAEHDERLLIAMEYVDGQTLRQWSEEQTDPEDARFSGALALLVQAGRGLMAAHEAGLIHRDFKPSNVLVGHDGRVRVADFGLAQSTGTPRQSETASTSGSGRATDASPTDARLTATGMAAGTPAYMAPEQLVVGPVDAKADQYSFCVTAWEILFGERPTPKETATDGGGPEVSALRSALLKGMREQPRRRHKDMAALVELIEPHASGQTRRADSTRRWLALSVSAAAVLGAVLGGQWLSSSRSRGNCVAAGDRVDEIWTPDVREQLQDGMISADASYGPFAAEKVMPRLDEYAESWRQDTTQACMNQHVHGTWDQETADRARWCLEDRLLRISAFATTMTEADSQTIQTAIKGAAALPGTQECLDRAGLSDQAPAPPAEIIPKIASLRNAVSRARALGTAGRDEDGLLALRHARDEATGVSWEPLEARMLLAESGLQRNLDNYDLAEEAGGAAYAAAVRADAWDIAANAAIHQILVVGDGLAKEDEGLLWADLARAAMDRSGDPFGLVEASYAHNVARLHLKAENLQEASRLATISLDQRRHALGDNHPDVAAVLFVLSAAADRLKDDATATQLAERGLRVYEEALGTDHPTVAGALRYLGGIYVQRGQIDKGQTTLQRALALAKNIDSENDLEAALLHSHFGNLYLRKAEPERAFQSFSKALRIQREILGEEHPDFAGGLYNIGVALSMQDEFAEAAPVLRRSLAISERTNGPNHVSQAWTAHYLGEAFRRMQHPGDAALFLERSVRIFELNYGDEHSDLAYPLSSLGSLAIDRGKFDEAIEFLDRAVRLDSTPPEYSATTRFDLARALWKTNKRASQERALTIARQVEADLVPGEHKDYAGEWITEREEWIAERKKQIAKRKEPKAP